MAKAEKSTSTNDNVALLQALEKTQQRYAVDARAARGIMLEARSLGDLKFVIRRLDGTVEPLDPHTCVLGDDAECFDTGIIDVPRKVPGRLGRPGNERCRVFVTQASLSAFLGPDAAEGDPDELPPPEPARPVSRAAVAEAVIDQQEWILMQRPEEPEILRQIEAIVGGHVSRDWLRDMLPKLMPGRKPGRPPRAK